MSLLLVSPPLSAPTSLLIAYQLRNGLLGHTVEICPVQEPIVRAKVVKAELDLLCLSLCFHDREIMILDLNLETFK